MMSEHRCSKMLLRDEFSRNLWGWAKPTWSKFEPVLKVAGEIGAVVGKGIGLLVGGLLMTIALLSLLLFLGLYIVGSAIARWLEEQRFEYRIKRLTPKQRAQIAASQGWKCYYGRKQLREGYHIDHKTPVSDIFNRDADPEEIESGHNLVATCPTHNQKKSSMNEKQFLAWMRENPHVRCYTKLGNQSDGT